MNSIYKLFFFFLLVEWVCWLSENDESVKCEVFCSRTQVYPRVVFMTVPKGGASQSLNASFSIHTSVEIQSASGIFVFLHFTRTFWWSAPQHTTKPLHRFPALILQRPTQQSYSSFINSLQEFRERSVGMVKLGQSRRSHDEVKSLSAKHFIVFQLLYLFSSEVLKYTRCFLPLLLFAMQITLVLFFHDICLCLLFLWKEEGYCLFCCSLLLYVIAACSVVYLYTQGSRLCHK